MKAFLAQLEARQIAAHTLLCVGLDSDLLQLPTAVKNTENPQLTFNTAVVDATHDLVCAYKLQLAFYEAAGEFGWQAMRKTVEYIHENHPAIPVIADAKRADIGSTSEAYATAIFDDLQFDACTLNPYLGSDALAPFLRRQDKGCIVLAHTSNPGASELQNLLVDGGNSSQPLWQVVLQKVAGEWNASKNCLAVMGATHTDELRVARELAPNLVFLVPGVGSQGGDLRATIEAGQDKNGRGLIINSSRGIIFADKSENFPLGAREVLQELFDQQERSG